MSSNIVVIGGGPAGYTAAFYAADLGMNVTLVEKDNTLGGVCLNVGCIPSKALLHLVALKDEAKNVKAHGLDFGEPKIDLDKIRAFKDSVVQKMTGGLVQLAKMRKVTVVKGTATFKDKNSLEVDTASGKQMIAFDNAIIATGSRPVIPEPFNLGSDLV
ncbi:MAG: FAD-dependent oxidoreductase, partial [Spirochaetia bacterium]|nr:FAD-dependent oxidoreductase [Spirochaetia bacterium]